MSTGERRIARSSSSAGGRERRVAEAIGVVDIGSDGVLSSLMQTCLRWRMADGGEQIAKYLCTRRRGMKKGKKTLRLVSVVSSDRLCKTCMSIRGAGFQWRFSLVQMKRPLTEHPEPSRRNHPRAAGASRKIISPNPDHLTPNNHRLPNAMKPLAYEKATVIKSGPARPSLLAEYILPASGALSAGRA